MSLAITSIWPGANDRDVRVRDSGADIIPNLSPQHHIRRLVNQVNYRLVHFKIAFRYADKEMFRK